MFIPFWLQTIIIGHNMKNTVFYWLTVSCCSKPSRNYPVSPLKAISHTCMIHSCCCIHRNAQTRNERKSQAQQDSPRQNNNSVTRQKYEYRVTIKEIDTFNVNMVLTRWSQRSPDSTPCNLFLWGVYQRQSFRSFTSGKFKRTETTPSQQLFHVFTRICSGLFGQN
jgi:hypothetical protein